MKHLKLLFVVTEDWYFVSHRLALAVAARKIGFDVIIATPEGSSKKIIKKAGLRFIQLNISRKYGNPFTEIARLIQLYKAEKPDIVHHVALKPVIYGTFAAIIAKVPRIINALAGMGWLFTSNHLFARTIKVTALKVIGKLLYVSKSYNIVQNPDDRKLLIRFGVPLKRLFLVLGAGVNTNIFTPQKKRKKPIVVLLAARMIWAKGIAEYVAAAKILSKEGLSVRFLLVGGGDVGNPGCIPNEVLRSWNGKNGIEWLGYRNDMEVLLGKAHIACLPSFYGEGVPKSLIEAASSGLPIVTTDTPGCREVVSDGANGFLLAPKDVPSLVNALRLLIKNEKLRLRMGKISRIRALSKFSEESIIKQTLAIYIEK